jgi:putative membrane protein
MNTLTRGLILAAALAPFAAAQAQSEKPPTETADPSAASTPHQRSTTGAKTGEAPAGGSAEAADASTPHQHSATKDSSAKNTKDGVTDEKMWKTQEEGAQPATFVKKAAVAGMTEVELANVALEKSQNPKVRAFAERMVADHGKANKELATIAKGKNLQVPTSLDAEHKSMVETMSSKSGAAFDAAYGEHMNMDHSKALALFEGASKSSDAELAAFAKKTLPTIKQHKQMAAELPGVRTAAGEPSSSSKK